jgi:hypothetical protein
MKKGIIFLLAGICLIASRPVAAQQSITVNSINLGLISENEFSSGSTGINTFPIFWQSDSPWVISISSLDPDLGLSDNGNYRKPLSDFLWRPSDEQQWLPLTQSPQEIAWGKGGGKGVAYIDIKALLDITRDAPGEYRSVLVFTIGPA